MSITSSSGDAPEGYDDHRPIPSGILRIALNELLNILGQDAKQQMLKGLKASGIDLDDESASYSVYQVRMYLHSVFEEDATELLTDVLRKKLAKIH